MHPTPWTVKPTEYDPDQTTIPVCPECVNGKHKNCDGNAWDDVEDELTDCRCEH